MMDKHGVLNWARSLVETNQTDFSNPENYFRHLGEVYDLAEALVGRVIARYPKIPIIAEEVSLASGLHDIGRPLNKNQVFHELRGANYTEKEGLRKGTASSMTDVYRIAQMFRSHGFAYENWLDPECGHLKSEFETLDSCLLVPRTWQEAIVTYSDLASLNGERVKLEDRMTELLHRYEHDPIFQNGVVLRAGKNAQNRLLKLAERVEALEQGKLTEGDIIKYGFL